MSIPDFNKSFRDAVFPGSEHPATTFNFMVSVGTRALGDFRSVEGIKYDMPVEKVYEGGRNHSPVILPFGEKGAGSWGTVTLKWGTPVWSLLYDWMNAVQVGHFYRRDVFILQLNRAGWPTRIMRLHRAFPVSWSAPKLDTSTSQPDLESLSLAFESFNMVLTRTGSMPSLDDLAATAGRVAALGRDTGLGIADSALDTFDDIGDLFDGDAYDGMEESFDRELRGGDLDWDSIEPEEIGLAGPNPDGDAEILEDRALRDDGDGDGAVELIASRALNAAVDTTMEAVSDAMEDLVDGGDDDDDDGFPW